VLLLDEPLSNLDARLRVEVRREIRQLQQRLGITTIFVTHDQEEANTICDRIAVMNSGRIAQVGTPMELYQRPDNLFVAGFLGSANIIEGLIVDRGGGLEFESPGVASIAMPMQAGAVAGAAQGPASMVFRPQSVMLMTPGQPPPAGYVCMPGRVTNAEFLGATIRYGITVGTTEAGREILADAGFRAGEQLHPAGTVVTVGVAAGALQWLKA
jgi:iron(III) transport system ATP-binding protein